VCQSPLTTPCGGLGDFDCARTQGREPPRGESRASVSSNWNIAGYALFAFPEMWLMSYVNADPSSRNFHITSDRWRSMLLGWHKIW
jgi:hypothetical protein